MAKARDEEEALRHMELCAKGARLSGAFSEWQKYKASLLNELLRVHDCVLDFGIGELSWQRQCGAFTGRKLSYYGVDFVPELVSAARAEFPMYTWRCDPFSAALDRDLYPERVDAILMLDVLYHIPSDALYNQMLSFAFDTVQPNLIVLTQATSMQKFDMATGPGGSGFCWFPRELPDWVMSHDEYWLRHTEDCREGVQRQRLYVFERV